MKEFQKIIKYMAIAFGLYLAITIIGIIVTVLLAISSGVNGLNIIVQQANVERVDETKEISEFSMLDIDLESGNLTIKTEGNKYKIETYQIPETSKIDVVNNKLVINDTKKFLNNKDSSITIYIPENTVLNKAEIDIETGALNINCLESNQIDFNFGAGNVQINNLVSSNTEIECGTGQVVIENSFLSNSNIETGVGKLKYSGYLKGNSKIECAIGEVSLELQGGNDLYKIKNKKGIGNIIINKESISDNTIVGDGPNIILLEGGIGNININM